LGVADELVVTHLVAVATFDIFVGIGLLGAGRGLVGVLAGGGAVAGGLTVSLAKIFDLIGHCFIQISKFSLQYL
jgi:hypothetical protein